MALRTLQDGRLSVATGRGDRLFNESATSGECCGVKATDGTYIYLYIDANGDICRRTANHWLTGTSASGTGTVVVSHTPAITGLAVAYDASADEIHMWYGLDSGPGTVINYRLSTDKGASWSAASAVISYSGSGWNADHVYPVGAYFGVTEGGTVKTLLFVLGDDAGTLKAGRYELVNATADFTDSLDYTAYGSNPISVTPAGTFPGRFVTFGYVPTDNTWHAYIGNGAAGACTQVYHDASLNQGLTWGRTFAKRANLVLDAGTGDDGDEARPSSFVFADGLRWLFYTGVSSSVGRPLIAVSSEDDHAFKVPGINNASLDVVYHAQGQPLRYDTARQHIHYAIRDQLGALGCAPFTPVTGSFGFRYIQIGTSGAGANSPNADLFSKLILTNPHIGEGDSFVLNEEIESCHILYSVVDDTGADQAFWLFPRCAVDPMALSEADDGSLVSIDFTCYGTRVPIHGRY